MTSSISSLVKIFLSRANFANGVFSSKTLASDNKLGYPVMVVNAAVHLVEFGILHCLLK